jgi:hypothetical protein
MFLVLFASRQKEQAQRSVKHLTEHIYQLVSASEPNQKQSVS